MIVSGRLVMLVLALVLAGCGPGAPVRVSPVSSLSDQCDPVPPGAERVTLTARDGVRLGAALLGPAGASVGVVLAHGATQTLCDWLTDIDGIATETRARVLIVDRRGVGSSEGSADAGKYPGDLADAASWLRAKGAGPLVLMGSSYGAPIALAAADASVCAVVAISPLRAIEEGAGSIRPLDRRPYEPDVWIAAEQGSPEIAANAASLFDGLGQDKRGRLLLVPGSDHSLALVQNHPGVRGLIAEAIRSCSRSS